MKKLLLLGGSRFALPVIEAAHELGCHVITCDYLPDNIAHRYSDEYCNVSIVEKNLVLQKARELKIDGILSFACDPGVVTAAYVAEQMGLPSCGPYESVCILQNKARFRSFLREHGFRVPAAAGCRSAEEALRKTEGFRWPLIVKPVDSAGSKGVARVDDPSELEQSIRRALEFSRSGEIIVEEFLEKTGCSSDTDSFTVNGQLRFVSFNAQRFDEHCQNPYTPSAYTWPATLSREHQQELTNEIQRLMDLLHMQTSVYNIETRECTDGKAYLMECSPRGGGNRLAEVLRYATGVDLIGSAVKAALGEPVTVEQRPYRGYWAEVILHSERPGVFRELNILPELSGEIVEQELWIEPGASVGGFSGANEAIGTVILRYEDQQTMERELEDIRSLIRVIVD